MSLPPHHGNQTLQLKIPWFPAGHVDWWVLMLFFAKCHSSRPRCLMYEVLVGHQPFWGSQEEIRQKVLAADVRYPPGLSEAAVHLMFCHWVLDSRWRRWAGSRWYIYIYTSHGYHGWDLGFHTAQRAKWAKQVQHASKWCEDG